MFFAWDITVTANTLEKSPKTQILKLSKGIITRVDVKFPAGCHRMVKVRLIRYGLQLIPLSGNEWVTGDDESVPTEGYYELMEAPAQLKFIACSPDTSYSHVISVRVQVLPRYVASVMPLVEIVTKLMQIIGVIR